MDSEEPDITAARKTSN